MPRAEQFVIPFAAIVDLGAPPLTLPEGTRAIMAVVGGTIDFTIGGVAITGFTVVSGTIYHGFFESIEAAVATDLWAFI